MSKPDQAINKTIKVFRSHEEAEDYSIDQVLNQDPQIRIRETVELILRVYGHSQESLKARTSNNKITILSGT